MTLVDIFSYFATLIAITLAPGPVVLMLMVRSASKDAKGAIGFGTGFAIGGLLIICAVCFGLSAWLTTFPAFFEYSKYLMMGYILWMAWGIWASGFDLNRDCKIDKRSILSSVLAGMATCFISPYMMILFPLVLPSMMDITAIEMPDFLIIAVTTFCAFAFGAFLIVAFAAQLTRLARSEQSMMVMNRSLASLLVVGGGWMALA